MAEKVLSIEWVDPLTGQKYQTVRMGGSTDNSGELAGRVVVDGLASNAVRQSAGTYNATPILGFRLLNVGTGTLTFTPNTTTAVPIVVTAAELTLMGINAYNDWPIACSSITAGTAMEIMVYIP